MRKETITREDIQRMALSEMMNKISDSKMSYTNEDIKRMSFNLLEKLDRKLYGVMNEAFDPNMLKDIDYIPPTEIPKILKQLIGDIYQRKSPFAPIRAIALFFSKEGAIGHTPGARTIISHFMKDTNVSHSVWVIQTKIKKLEEVLAQRGQGFQLVYDVSYIIDDITNAVSTLIAALNKNYQLDWFRGSETVDGSKDGRRKGLASILMQAGMNMQKLKDVIDTLKKFAGKGKDAMSYNQFK